MNHAAGSKGPERDAIYIEYNVETPWEGGTGRSCCRMLTNRKKPTALTQEDEGKAMVRGGSERLRNGTALDSHCRQETVKFSGTGVSLLETYTFH